MRNHLNFGKTRNDKNRPWIEILNEIPHMAGMYCIWKGEILLYIGQAENLRDRLVSHNLRDLFLDLKADRVSYIRTGPCHYKENKMEKEKEKQTGARMCRLRMEQWLIAKHKPLINRTEKIKSVKLMVK